MIAGQLADLTRTVEEMAKQLKALRERADRQQQRADSQHERTEIQQERIDLAAREINRGQRPSTGCGERAPRVSLNRGPFLPPLRTPTTTSTRRTHEEAVRLAQDRNP